ncbi:hypothetical protein JW887_05510, partial [Candidatus Dojkabacteria bacterium]|nr:hypothetical protein [Candidatus Dojkabacteria bacterium]
FYKFPVLFYDTLHSTSFSKSGHYLPDDLSSSMSLEDCLLIGFLECRRDIALYGGVLQDLCSCVVGPVCNVL